MNYSGDFALSVIIPFHNDSLTKILESLLLCDDKDFCEVILVSDGLQGAALSFIEPFEKSLCIVVILSEKCGRIGHLRNLGIQQARSEWLYFVDSDCSLKKDAIKRILAHKAACRVLKGRNEFVGRNRISRLDAQLREERYESNPRFAYCPNLLVHVSIFQELGLFNSQRTYGSDGDFAKSISISGIEVTYDRDIVIYHDCTDSMTGVFKKWMKMGEARYYRYHNEFVKNRLSTYFPNLFTFKRGVMYNCVAVLCDIGRAVGMLCAWHKSRQSKHDD